MSEPVAPSPAPAPEPSPAPAPAPAPAAPAAAERPAWVPEQYWDPKANALNTDEFGKHYGEQVAQATKYAERLAGVPAKPEDYKVELKLPDTVKVPEGVTFDPAKDPSLPLLLKEAHARGWSNDDVNTVIALDAQLKIADYHARAAQLVAEDKKLGEKPTERRAAVANWLKALRDKKDITADEFAAADPENMNAAGVILLEKLMAKANGTVPGHVPTPPPQPEPKTIADRIWPGGFSSTPQSRTG